MLPPTAHTPVILSESRCALARLQPVFNPSVSSAAFASKFRLESSSKEAREPHVHSRPLGVPVPTDCIAASWSTGCFLGKGGFCRLSSVIVAVQTERNCPAPPALRQKSHRFDSVLKAGSASTMEACGKTITPAGL